MATKTKMTSPFNNKLVEDNLGLVRTIVKNYYISRRYDYDDLYQIGTIGLMKSTQHFDASKKIPFSSYAAKYIKWEIKDYINKHKKPEGWSIDKTVNYSDEILDGCPPDYKLILQYKYWYNHDLPTISKLINKNQRQTKLLLMEALDYLSECLEEN